MCNEKPNTRCSAEALEGAKPIRNLALAWHIPALSSTGFRQSSLDDSIDVISMAAVLQQDLNAYLSSTKGAQLQMLIYSGNGVSMYRCVSVNNSPFICKVLVEVRDHQILEKEASMQGLLKHPGIITQYGHFWLQSNGENFLVIMLEYCEKDLYTDMEMRRKAQFYWSEEEMWAHTRTLVGALAFAQSQGVAHRNIKPQSIFLTSNGQVKIGNWSSSKYIQNIENTLTGTPVFLSPLQKQALLSYTASLQHDVFKSDVYSLGLTLLVMALTEEPVALTTTPETYVDRLPYSDNFKDMLRIMIALEESDRCDLTTLWSWLSPPSVPVQPETNPFPAENSNAAIESLSPELSADAQPPSVSKVIPTEEQKQVYTKPTTACLWKDCGAEITQYGPKIVQLYCDAQHAFCSKQCFAACLHYSTNTLQAAQPKCPKCQVEIDPEVTQQFPELVEKKSTRGCLLQ